MTSARPDSVRPEIFTSHNVARYDHLTGENEYLSAVFAWLEAGRVGYYRLVRRLFLATGQPHFLPRLMQLQLSRETPCVGEVMKVMHWLEPKESEKPSRKLEFRGKLLSSERPGVEFARVKAIRIIVPSLQPDAPQGDPNMLRLAAIDRATSDAQGEFAPAVQESDWPSLEEIRAEPRSHVTRVRHMDQDYLKHAHNLNYLRVFIFEAWSERTNGEPFPKCKDVEIEYLREVKVSEPAGGIRLTLLLRPAGRRMSAYYYLTDVDQKTVYTRVGLNFYDDERPAQRPIRLSPALLRHFQSLPSKTTAVESCFHVGFEDVSTIWTFTPTLLKWADTGSLYWWRKVHEDALSRSKLVQVEARDIVCRPNQGNKLVTRASFLGLTNVAEGVVDARVQVELFNVILNDMNQGGSVAKLVLTRRFFAGKTRGTTPIQARLAAVPSRACEVRWADFVTSRGPIDASVYLGLFQDDLDAGRFSANEAAQELFALDGWVSDYTLTLSDVPHGMSDQLAHPVVCQGVCDVEKRAFYYEFKRQGTSEPLATLTMRTRPGFDHSKDFHAYGTDEEFTLIRRAEGLDARYWGLGQGEPQRLEASL